MQIWQLGPSLQCCFGCIVSKEVKNWSLFLLAVWVLQSSEMYEPGGAFCEESKQIRGRAHRRYLLELPSIYCCSSGYNCTLHFIMAWVFRVEFCKAVPVQLGQSPIIHSITHCSLAAAPWHPYTKPVFSLYNLTSSDANCGRCWKSLAAPKHKKRSG